MNADQALGFVHHPKLFGLGEQAVIHLRVRLGSSLDHPLGELLPLSEASSVEVQPAFQARPEMRGG